MTDLSNFSIKQVPPNNYSGVTIHINNPSVNAGLGNPQIPPMQNDNPYIGTHNGYMQACKNPCCNPNEINAMKKNPSNVLYTHNGIMPDNNHTRPEYPAGYYMNNYAQNPIVYNNEPAPEENLDISKGIITKIDEAIAEQKNLEKTGKQKRIVALTNEYIMSLENYLNNPNNEIRVMAAKEILTRLDEDKSRYDDLALNALLNKMLQDPSKLVRIAAMSAFSSGLASGNEYTIQLLQDIQNNPNSNKDDVVQAANILLMMSGETELIYEPAKPKEEKKSAKADEMTQQQMQQLREQLQKYKEKQIEQELANQMQK